MKKNIVKLSVLAFLLSGLVSCTNKPETPKASKPQENTACSADSECDQETPDMKKELSRFQEISMDEAADLIENKESGIIYFGFENCPWCQQALPVFLDCLDKETEGKNTPLYYVCTRDDKGELLYSSKEKEKILPYIKDYMSDNEDGELTLFVPLFISVNKGEVMDGHVGTLESHDAHERSMTSKEISDLEKIYKNLIDTQK